MNRSTIMVLISLLITSLTLAQGTAEQKRIQNKVKDVVIDFDADVIEGERKVPDIFISTEIGAPNIESVIYFRKNFNDFHRLELRAKPTYSNK